MRKPNLAKSVFVGAAEYSTAAMLREFVWGHPSWSTDEASVASFERCVAALKVEPFMLEDRDFDRACGVLRQVQFPAHASIECAELRNAFVLTTKEKEP